MSGDVENVHLWAEAHVLVAPVSTALPATIEEEFPGGWEPVGFLAGDEDMPENFEEQTTRFHEWSGGIVAESHREQVITVEFTPIEWNDVVRDLVWPGSDNDELRLGQPARVLFATEFADSDIKRRKITAGHAKIRRSGAINRSPSQVEKFPLTATIYPLPAANGNPPTYWTTQETVGSS